MRAALCSNNTMGRPKLLNERHISGNKLVVFQVLERNPSAILVIGRCHFSGRPIDEICEKPYGTMLVLVHAFTEVFPDVHLHAELFLHFTGQTLLRSLPPLPICLPETPRGEPYVFRVFADR